MIVTIDGPAGAGKSSAARTLAKRLDFHFLDTGSMYRAVVHGQSTRGSRSRMRDPLEQVAVGLDIQLTDDGVFVNGQDVTRAIRTLAITSATRHAADHPRIRERLVQLQREATVGQDFVTEGRDQGSIVFPEAECKVFLTASETRPRRAPLPRPDRSRRRRLVRRCARETTRTRPARCLASGRGVIQAPDAVVLDTDGMSSEEVVDRFYEIVQKSSLPLKSPWPPFPCHASA